jgi:membrane protein implicated in regulation of membrane protease activity
MTLLPEMNAFGVFLVIAGAGLIFLVVSLFVGEISDHFDTSLDHDLDHGGPSVFSPRVMSVFVTAFGGVGAIATYYGLSPVPASLTGFGSGVVLSALVLAFARFLYRQQATSEVRTSDLVGQSGRVVIAIPPGGVGQVRCRVGEELVDKIARAHDGRPVPEHTAVRVDEVLGDTVVVSRQVD